MKYKGALKKFRGAGTRHVALSSWLAAFASAMAQDADFTRNLADLSIEQLMNESVTSVSKKEESLFQAAAAVSILTNDDLRRSGATTLVDALRLVPGVNVGAVNSSQSAVSARGFNGVFSNKMLVMVDGRAVYNSLFAGVLWDLRQTMLEDVDRVEVIRGPGAAVWGANAMNGVISVVSRSARDTQGGLVYGGAGNVHEVISGMRYGGRIGEDTYYRVFGGYQLNDEYSLPGGGSAEDGWLGWQGGFRLDHHPSADTQFTWQADMNAVEMDHDVADSYNASTLARWTRELSGRSSVEVQAYYDRLYRDDVMRARVVFDTFDLTAEHMLPLGEHHDLMWGLGYRFIETELEQTNPMILVRNPDFGVQLFSAFLQDEFRIVPDMLTLTSGVKLEHNDYTGFEIQPSLRASYQPAANQTLWAAVSRAVRTPSAVEGMDALGFISGAPFAGPGGLFLPTVVGNGNPAAEILWAYELGYRIQPTSQVSVDIAAFYNHYTDLLAVGTVERFNPGVPVGTAELPLQNFRSANTYGGEVSVTYTPADAWRLTAGYSLIIADIDGTSAINPQELEGSIPTHQAILRSAYDFTAKASLDLQLRAVDQIADVPEYVTVDLRLSYRPSENLEFSLVGQNLLDSSHPEQGAQPVTVGAEVPRGFYGKVVFKF